MQPNQAWLPELGVIEVAAPCHQDWEAMTGTEQRRHCAACKLNVYDLSALTTEEARRLVQKTEGRLCVRFFKRADGRLLTRDCPMGLAARARRKLAAVAAALAALIAFCTGAFSRLGRDDEAPSGPPPCEPIPRIALAPAAVELLPGGPDWAERRRAATDLARVQPPMQGRMMTLGVIRSQVAQIVPNAHPLKDR